MSDWFDQSGLNWLMGIVASWVMYRLKRYDDQAKLVQERLNDLHDADHAAQIAVQKKVHDLETRMAVMETRE